MDFRNDETPGDGALRELWDLMMERSFDPADWFVDDDPPAPEGD